MIVAVPENYLKEKEKKEIEKKGKTEYRIPIRPHETVETGVGTHGVWYPWGL